MRVILVLLRLVRGIRVEVSLSLLGSLMVLLLLAGVLLLVRLMMPSSFLHVSFVVFWTTSMTRLPLVLPILTAATVPHIVMLMLTLPTASMLVIVLLSATAAVITGIACVLHDLFFGNDKPKCEIFT